MKRGQCALELTTAHIFDLCPRRMQYLKYRPTKEIIGAVRQNIEDQDGQWLPQLPQLYEVPVQRGRKFREDKVDWERHLQKKTARIRDVTLGTHTVEQEFNRHEAPHQHPPAHVTRLGRSMVAEVRHSAASTPPPLQIPLARVTESALRSLSLTASPLKAARRPWREQAQALASSPIKAQSQTPTRV